MCVILQKKKAEVYFSAKTVPVRRISPKIINDEKVDPDTPKRHHDHLFATGLGRQAFVMHFATSRGKKRIPS